MFSRHTLHRLELKSYQLLEVSNVGPHQHRMNAGLARSLTFVCACTVHPVLHLLPFHASCVACRGSGRRGSPTATIALTSLERVWEKRQAGLRAHECTRARVDVQPCHLAAWPSLSSASFSGGRPSVPCHSRGAAASEHLTSFRAALRSAPTRLVAAKVGVFTRRAL